jgi:hypothetical protein
MASAHEPFAELAAGYAVDALDPPDEEEFLAHLRDCDRCQQAVAGFSEVAAKIAESQSDLAPSGPDPRLGDRIMAAVAGEQCTGPADLAKRRRQRAARMAIAAAAAAALIAGGVIWGTRSAGNGRLVPPAAGCSSAGTCHRVVLAGGISKVSVASVIVAGRTVWLIPAGLRPDDVARQTYVLWQITARRKPRAVGAFDVRGNRQRAVLVGSLAVGYGDTRAFAVTLERGRAIPPVPSSPVATGLVSS